MTRFALTVELDGRPFMGWQRQSHGPSVQQTIEDAAHAITGERPGVHAAGRTDSGVHGIATRAHLDIAKDITPFRMMEALNAKMRPLPLAVIDVNNVDGDWHALFSCSTRAHVLLILN